MKSLRQAGQTHRGFGDDLRETAHRPSSSPRFRHRCAACFYFARLSDDAETRLKADYLGLEVRRGVSGYNLNGCWSHPAAAPRHRFDLLAIHLMSPTRPPALPFNKVKRPVRDICSTRFYFSPDSNDDPIKTRNLRD